MSLGDNVLILVVVEDGLVLLKQDVNEVIVEGVLILVVVEDGLVLATFTPKGEFDACLNPCCSGRWSRTSCCLCFRA